MTTLSDLLGFLEELAPLHSAEPWDNSGLLVERQGEDISRVLLALDITPQVVQEAARRQVQVIFSHHSVIFSPLKRLELENPAVQLARGNIAAICMHTNLDAAALGVNTQLAQIIGLEQVRPIGGEAIGVLGELANPQTPSELAQLVKERLGAPFVEFCAPESQAPIRTLGLCSGAGGEFAQAAFVKGAQAFLTGEIKYHDLLDARMRGECILSAGHYYTEALVMPPLKKLLEQRFPQVQFLLSEAQRAPGTVI